ncbi:hypothetical protein [Ornithinimicrobium kibberense]|uniref:hypothetical protein n=1 Tax=Ornithinimicrobium kibberense TaxID=282060 RepID=UPI003622A702
MAGGEADTGVGRVDGVGAVELGDRHGRSFRRGLLLMCHRHYPIMDDASSNW